MFAKLGPNWKEKRKLKGRFDGFFNYLGHSKTKGDLGAKVQFSEDYFMQIHASYVGKHSATKDTNKTAAL